MSLGTYSMIVAALVGAPLVALWPALGSRGDGAFAAVALAGVLAGLNGAAAYALVSWSFGRSNPAFFKAVVGGTLGRLIVLLGAVVVAILGFDLPRLPLVIALLSYYVAFLALELAVVHRRPLPRPEAVR